MKPMITRMTISSAPKRPKPHAGDRKMIRGVLHERVWARCTIGPGKGAMLVSNGRPVWEWIPVVEEKDRPEYPCGYMQQRGAA